MKITGFEVFPVVCPPPFRGGRSWLFVRLDTDRGISGYGEMMMLGTGFRLPVLAAMMADLIEQAVIGHDPYDTELLFDKVYGRAGYSHYPELTKLGILSATDMACWDIIGKDCGQPVYKLLGGQMRDRVRTYTYIYDDPAERAASEGQGDGSPLSRDTWLDPARAAARARHYAGQGFTAIKVDPFSLTLTHDQSLGQNVPLQFSLTAADTAERVIGAIRDEVGTGCDIIIGTHGQMTAAGALRIARRLERFDPLWYEEPCPPENMNALAEVARRTTIPIATGERLTTKFDFARLLEHRAAAVFNFDVGQVGGILEAKKIASMAEAHYVQVAPHVYGGPLIAAAALQLSLCSPNFLIMEAIERFDGVHAQFTDAPLAWHEGYLLPPAGPGLGVNLNEDLARSHAPHGPQPGTIRSY
ncbi:MAG TPA: mandelate racemase/muconate lactonizing enzyme family protein [Trebonia sp.]|nr:mandelate racemase/muconate lactonizing enzyme family protein [Trebonia sp.]